MAEKRYINDKGEIVRYCYEVRCGGDPDCYICPNAKRNNKYHVFCGKYFEVDPAAWMKNKGYREIFELENYTDKWCVMACANDSQSEMFAKFLDKNGMKWRDGHSYIDDQCWRSTNDIGTGFVFNQGIQCYPGCYSDFDEIVVLHFEDYVFKMEDKKMEKKQFTVKDLKNGYRVKNRNGDIGVIFFHNEENWEILFKDGLFSPKKFYRDDLTHIQFSSMDILKVYPCKEAPGTLGDLTMIGGVGAIWTREEVKEMTVAEIEKALGYSIKVVK